jgi:hypothetical protein
MWMQLCRSMSEIYHMSIGARTLVRDHITSQIRKLESELTVGNYFERIGEVNRLKKQLEELNRYAY